MIKPKRLPLPVRRTMNLTDEAYAKLRQLNQAYGLGNNYLMVVLLENLDQIEDTDALVAAYQSFISDYGAPEQ